MKKKTAVILLIIVIIAVAVGFFVYQLWNREDKTEVQTSYGDVFTITFDDYLVKSLVQDRDTGWYYTFSSKLTTEDIEECSNANNNRIYRIGQIVIWKENGTFVTFDGDLERNAEATSAVKAHLLSDSLFFVHNIDAFLKSETYLAEVSDVVVRFCNGEYDELSQYGLSDNVRNNADQMALLKENAMKYLQKYHLG